ncbi:zinc finger, CCHC-type containing protein [Tanacetum coccineum]
MDEAIQVSCIIDKLLPSWKDFKHTLKHHKEALTLVEFDSHLRIKGSLRLQDSDKPKGNNVAGPLVVNMCGKPGHLKKDCKGGKIGDKANGLGTNGSVNGSSNSLKGATVHRETEVLELIHSYLCNLHATPSLGNKKYFVRFTDDASRFCYVYLLHTKDEELDKFKVFKTKVELQQGSLIKRFRTDRGGLSQGFWGEDMAVVRLPDPKMKTLGERGIECIFVGYAEHSKAFRFYVIEPNESVSINSIIESSDDIFDENKISSVPRPSQRKLKVDGTIEKFKARLVIQGFRQKSAIDYFITYDSVACISTIRLLIIVASIHNLIIHQTDVKTTFLNGEMDNEQAHKQWNQKFDEVVLCSGYLLNQADKCVYSKFDESELFSSRFSIKDMGEADVILGIRIKHESNKITISQSHYIEKVLKKFNYFDCTPISTPIDTSKKLMPNNYKAVSQLDYSRMIGCLMYAMTCTRPDIAFVVGKLSSLRRIHDASWINNIEDNSSTSGWIFLFGGGAISWASKKQTCITSSIMESEFMALAAAGKEAEWLRNLILEIPLWSKPITPISIRCDNAATLAKAYRQIYNGKSKHLGVRHYNTPYFRVIVHQ